MLRELLKAGMRITVNSYSLKAHGHFGAERTGVCVRRMESVQRPFEAMWLSMAFRFSWSPPRGNRSGADLSGSVADGNGLIANGGTFRRVLAVALG